ncbi:hypothetical protein Scep_023040 [Stephania cephalantha]|uniref:Uncharacterized protein n=1 Tax=Stephania cephalantha TaxID=152367 RepID=A0AAP0F7J7_9MAGN
MPGRSSSESTEMSVPAVAEALILQRWYMRVKDSGSPNIYEAQELLSGPATVRLDESVVVAVVAGAANVPTDHMTAETTK